MPKFRDLAAHTMALIMSCVLAAGATATPNQATSRPTDNIRISIFEELKQHRDIVMLGDSITARGEWGEFFPGVSIANRGISGDTTAGMLARLHQVIEIKPKAVFIMAGINDLIAGENTQNITSNYIEIINTLYKSGSQVFVQSTLYVSQKSRISNNEKVRSINNELSNYCTKSAKCKFIDLNIALSPKGVLDRRFTGDGIHLTGKGYMAWVKSISNPMEKSAMGSQG